jgi:hypothetical protein
MGKAGVGLLAGGTVATAAGLGLSLAEEPADPNMPLNKITIHPAGYAILAVGAAALVTGAVLLVLDRRQAKRAVQVAPTAAPPPPASSCSAGSDALRAWPHGPPGLADSTAGRAVCATETPLRPRQG